MLGGAKYINAFTDYGFKRLFGEEGNKNLLVSFLNDILPIEHKIVSLTFKPNEQRGDTVDDRHGIYDVFCEDEKGVQFIVEMQNARQLYFKDRSVFYSTFPIPHWWRKCATHAGDPIRQQAIKGDWNYKLKAVYCVGLLGFELQDDYATSLSNGKEEIILHDQPYYHEVKLKDQHNELFYDKLTFVYIELPKFNKTEAELNSHFDKWLYFLKNLQEFDEIPAILNEPIFEEAFKVSKVAAFTTQELSSYEQSLKYYRDSINKINTAMLEGIQLGAKNKNLENARSIIGLLPDEIIAQKFNLSVDVVKKLHP